MRTKIEFLEYSRNLNMQSSKNEPMCDVQDKALKQVCVVGSKNE
jgi:hypothetical protein